MFVLNNKILAVTIRSRQDIQGIMIGQEEFKLVQYADDLTLFVPNIECAEPEAYHLSFWQNSFFNCLIDLQFVQA